MISVGIFAKPPRANLVKTRLIPEIGADNATRIYRHCLQYTVDIVQQSALAYRFYLSEFCNDDLFQSAEISVQQGPDLGMRMFNATRDMLSTHPGGAIIIGSDCLDITPGHLHLAAHALASHDLVLLPALDGGYALIGCTRIEAGLLQNVSSRTCAVLQLIFCNSPTSIRVQPIRA